MAELMTAFEKSVKKNAQTTQLTQDITLIDPFTGECVDKNCAKDAIVFEPTAIRFEVMEKQDRAVTKKAQSAEGTKDLGDFSSVIES